MLLKALCECSGAPGGEKEVRQYIAAELERIGCPYEIDNLGNVIAHHPGKAGEQKVLFAAHMDEPALMIYDVTERGFLRFKAVGTRVIPRQLSGRTVRVGENVMGVVGFAPYHMMRITDEQKRRSAENQHIDIAAESKERALERAAVVLQNMVNAAVIAPEQKAKALKMPIGAGIHDKLEGGRYFADWVYQEVNAYIGERENDINVYTTLDKKIQKAAESALRQAIFANAKSKNVTNGAVVVLDRNGAVKAMAGGINYEKSQFNRATQALRQPGSAFKTFVYLPALEEGWDTDDEIDDYPITIGNWKPENYSKKYYGTVTLEEAFVRSLNLATVNLAQKLPSGDIIRTARKMGISTPIDDTPAMVLGSSAVKVLDMAVAYTAVANGGYAAWPYSITEIYTREGYPLYTRLYDEDERQRILDEDTVEAMTEMMEKVILEGTGKRAQLPFFAAGKTGTSQDYRDAWFVGFTDRYVAAVWVGNDDNSPMKGVGGGTLPAEIWKKVMLAAESEE